MGNIFTKIDIYGYGIENHSNIYMKKTGKQDVLFTFFKNDLNICIVSQ